MILSKIKKNFLHLFYSEIINKIIILFYPIILTRYLGSANYGKYTFAISFSTLFAVIADFGISSYLAKELPRKKDKSSIYFKNSLILKLILSCCTLLIIYFTLIFYEQPAEIKNFIYLACINIIIISFNELLRSLFRASEKLSYEAKYKIAHNVALLFLGIMLVILNQPLIYFFITAIISSLVELALLLKSSLYLKLINFSSKINLKLCKNILKNAWPFGLGIVFSTLFFHVDSVIIGIIRDTQEVGLYAAAYKLILVSYSIPLLLSISILPQLSNNFIKNHNRFKRIYKKAKLYSVVSGLAICLVLLSFSSFIILTLFGSEFSNSIPLFQILAISIPFKYLSIILGIVLTAIDKQKKRLLALCICTIFNIITNIFLISYIGNFGAAITTLFSEILLLILYYSFSRKFIKSL